MKILNLHGLNGSCTNTAYRFLSEYYKDAKSVEIISPQLDYAVNSPYSILDEIRIQCSDPDIVVGTSFGGFFAYIVGATLGCKTVLINPCIPPHRYIPKLVSDYKYTDILELIWSKYSQISLDYNMILGNNDTVLDIQTTLNNLCTPVDNYTIISGGHSLNGEEYETWFKEILR